MKLSIAILIFISIVSCNKKGDAKPNDFSKVEIKTIVKDSLLNIRALEIISEVEGCFFLTSKGKAGNVYLSELDKKLNVVYPIMITEDTLTLNFRSFAYTSKYGFGLSIGSPALLIKIKNDEKSIVYKETHPKAFYDAIDFWNNQEGLAIGDPTEDCMSIIITRDGGNTWTKLSCNDFTKN